MPTVATTDELDALVEEADLGGEPRRSAERLYDMAMESPRGEGSLRAEVLVAASEQLAMAGEHERAIYCAREAVADGGHVRRGALSQLAAALHQAGEHEEARAALTELRRTRPADVKLHLLVGGLCEQYGDFDDAVRWYTRGLVLSERGELSGEDTFVAGVLLVCRAELRSGMGLPADDWDEVGERIALRAHTVLSQSLPPQRQPRRRACPCGSGRKARRCCESGVSSYGSAAAVTSREGDTVVIDVFNA